MLDGLEKEVEVNGRKHVVKVIGGWAEFDVSRDGKKLLRLRITAEVDGVRSDYTITYGRYERNNAAVGFAYASVDAPGGREADAERLSALVEALTGVKPKMCRRSDGTIEIVCGRERLDGFMRYTELADAIEKWLEEKPVSPAHRPGAEREHFANLKTWQTSKQVGAQGIY